MKILILKQTVWNGEPVLEDSEIDIDGDVAVRWIQNGIAEEVLVVVSDEEETEDAGPYVGFKAKALYELCIERGIAVEPKQKVDFYAELLVADDTTKLEEAAALLIKEEEEQNKLPNEEV